MLSPAYGPARARRVSALSGAGRPSASTCTTVCRPRMQISPSRRISQRVRDRGRADLFRGELELELVLEAQHRQVLRLDLAPRVVGPVVQQPERPQQRRLGRLRPPERRREVDPAARVRVHPRDPRLQDVARRRHRQDERRRRSRSRSSYFLTLPVDVFGSSPNSISLGALKPGQRLAREGDQLLGRERRARPLSATKPFGRSPHFSSGIATTAASSTSGMADERALDLDRRDVLAAGDDDVLRPVAHLDVAVGVHHRRGRRSGTSRRGRPRRSPASSRK